MSLPTAWMSEMAEAQKITNAALTLILKKLDFIEHKADHDRQAMRKHISAILKQVNYLADEVKWINESNTKHPTIEEVNIEPDIKM